MAVADTAKIGRVYPSGFKGGLGGIPTHDSSGERRTSTVCDAMILAPLPLRVRMTAAPLFRSFEDGWPTRQVVEDRGHPPALSL